MSEFLTDNGVLFALICAGAAVVYGAVTSRALLAIVEPRHGAQLAPVRDGLSQLQMHYVRSTGGPAATEAPAAPTQPAAPAQPARPQGPQGPQPGDAQRSGRLWIPGQ